MAAPLTIGLFGPMRVLVGDRPLPPVRSRKALWLLALLTLRHGRPVAREWIASTLWPDTDLPVAFTNLRPVIWELRRALGDQAYRLQSPDRVTVILDLEGADVDVAAFEAAIRAGQGERALEIYRGPLLEGCPEEWAPQERSVREQDCIQVLQSLADAALTEGNHSRAADLFQRLIAFDPWRDASRRGLMAALAGSGDVNAALQTYRNYAHLLRSEANLTPDDQTTALYASLRAHTRQRPIPKAPETAAPKISGSLPHALTPLFGREDERLEVAGLLRNHRLLTLTGPGGIGKTRLATCIAKDTEGEYRGGVWLVSLENLRDGNLIPGQVAATLSIREEGEADPIKSLVTRIRRENLLLVLDNCEHLLESVIPFCAQLLAECGDIRILATSRAALGIMGERVYPVPALAVPEPHDLPGGSATRLRVLKSYEGAQLFIDRAQAVNQDFQPTPENTGAIAQICARLEGLPLALELAAARVKAMTVEQIAARLDDHLRLLAGGNRGAAGRQQTLRATLDWSYALLSSSEGLLLQRLTVFSGGWTLEAAEAVTVSDGIERAEIAELHDGLIAKSMVGFDKRTGRFHLLETVRQYAAEKLLASGGAPILAKRHREWVLGLAQTAEAAYRGPQQGQWLDRLEMERPNLRSALAACEADPRAGLLLAGALWRFWYIRGPHAEGGEQLRAALERPCRDEAALAKAWYGRGCLAYTRTDHPLARHCIFQALALYQSLHHRLGIAEAYNVLGNIECAVSNNALARSHYEASLRIRRELGNPADLALILYNLGTLTLPLCEFRESERYLREARSLYEALGDECGCAWCQVALGCVYQRTGAYPEAQAHGEASHRRFAALADKRGIGWTSYLLSRLAQIRGEYDAAGQLTTQSRAAFSEVGDRNGLGLVGMVAGMTEFENQNLIAARRNFEGALEDFQAIGAAYGTAWAMFELGQTLYLQGETVAGRKSMAEGIEIREAVGDRCGVADSLIGFAALACDRSDYPRAARLLGAAQAIRAAAHAGLTPVQQAAAHRILASIRASLGDARLNRAIADGAQMTVAEAVDDAIPQNPALAL